MVILVTAGDDVESAVGISLWLVISSVAVYFLSCKVIRAWQDVLAEGGIEICTGAISMTMFAAAGFYGETWVLWQFAKAVSLGATVVLFLTLSANFLFYHLLKAPTLLGRRTMDQIAGFADYLSVAEQDRMNLLNPPDRTPELFEKFLPYALALGVEHAWSKQFAGILVQASTPDETGRRTYCPHWYSGGTFGQGSFRNLATTLGGGFAGSV